MRDVRGGVRPYHLDDFDVLRPDVLLFFAERVRNLMLRKQTVSGRTL